MFLDDLFWNANSMHFMVILSSGSKIKLMDFCQFITSTFQCLQSKLQTQTFGQDSSFSYADSFQELPLLSSQVAEGHVVPVTVFALPAQHYMHPSQYNCERIIMDRCKSDTHGRPIKIKKWLPTLTSAKALRISCSSHTCSSSPRLRVHSVEMRRLSARSRQPADVSSSKSRSSRFFILTMCTSLSAAMACKQLVRSCMLSKQMHCLQISTRREITYMKND